MLDRYLRSPIAGGSGVYSPREYSGAEIAAARRLKMVEGKHDTLRGAMFWATGDWHLRNLAKFEEEALQRLKDIELIREAIDREWDKPFDGPETDSKHS